MNIVLEASPKILVKVYGSDYQISKPKVGQIEKVASDLDSAEKDSMKYKVLTDFLVTLGLPENVVTSLEVEHFQLLCESLMASKKK